MHLQLGEISVIVALSLSPRNYSTLAVQYQIKTKHIIQFRGSDQGLDFYFKSTKNAIDAKLQVSF